MENQLDIEIHNRLVNYIVGDSTLDAFRDWFDVKTWDVAQSGNPDARELTAEIDLRLAEFSNGHRSEQDLRQVLTPLVTAVRHGMWTNGTTTSTNSTMSQVAVPGSVADIRVGTVFA